MRKDHEHAVSKTISPCPASPLRLRLATVRRLAPPSIGRQRHERFGVLKRGHAGTLPPRANPAAFAAPER